MRLPSAGLFMCLIALSACQFARVEESPAEDGSAELASVSPASVDQDETTFGDEVADEPGVDEADPKTEVQDVKPETQDESIADTPVGQESPVPDAPAVAETEIPEPTTREEVKTQKTSYVRKGYFAKLLKICDVQDKAEDAAVSFRKLPTGKRLWIEDVNSDWKLVYSSKGPAYMRRDCFEAAARIEEPAPPVLPPPEPPSEPQAEVIAPKIEATAEAPKIVESANLAEAQPTPSAASKGDEFPPLPPFRDATDDLTMTILEAAALIAGALAIMIWRRKRKLRSFDATETFVTAA